MTGRHKWWDGKRHLWFAAAVDRDTTLANAALSPRTQGSADSVGKYKNIENLGKEFQGLKNSLIEFIERPSWLRADCINPGEVSLIGGVLCRSKLFLAAKQAIVLGVLGFEMAAA